MVKIGILEPGSIIMTNDTATVTTYRRWQKKVPLFAKVICDDCRRQLEVETHFFAGKKNPSESCVRRRTKLHIYSSENKLWCSLSPREPAHIQLMVQIMTFFFLLVCAELHNIIILKFTWQTREWEMHGGFRQLWIYTAFTFICLDADLLCYSVGSDK